MAALLTTTLPSTKDVASIIRSWKIIYINVMQDLIVSRKVFHDGITLAKFQVPDPTLVLWYLSLIKTFLGWRKFLFRVFLGFFEDV